MIIKITISLFCFLATLTIKNLSAQTYAVDKGTIILPHKIHYAAPWRDLHKNDNFKPWQPKYSFNPEINGFLFSNFFLGGQLNYSKSIHQRNFRSSSLSVGPKVGVAAGHLFSDVFPYLSMAALLTGIGDNTASNVAPVWEQRYIFKGGTFISIVEDTGLDVSLSYMIINETSSLYDNNNPNHTFVFGIGLVEFLYN